jgi:hypothetical protein
MIRESFRVLKKGGAFILTTENYFNAYFLVWLKCWLLRKPFDSGSGIQPHENFFLFPMLLRWFRRVGFRITRTTSNHFQFLLFPGTSPSKLVIEDFNSAILKQMFKPFGRHYTYQGKKL